MKQFTALYVRMKQQFALQDGEGEAEIDKAELVRGKLSPFVTKFSSKAYLLRATVQSFEICKERYIQNHKARMTVMSWESEQ